MTAPSSPLSTRREDLLARLAEPHPYDVAVIGGGATGLGIALDAAARGFSVVLVESHDFAKGTSSRATKLVHGGVRYLAQGNISLVREALHERSRLLHNAPHLAHPLPFVMPSYKVWETPFYGAGLLVYDALAGQAGLGKTEFLVREKTLRCLPTVQPRGLKGGVKYWDGQFDDARLALALARTAARQGALLVNYCAATGLVHEGGKVVGLSCEDRETGRSYTLRARFVINAAGVWVDEFRQKDGKPSGASCSPWWRPARAFIWWWTGPFYRASTRCWCPAPRMAGCCLPCRGWARSSWARPTRRVMIWHANPSRSGTKSSSSCAKRPAI